MTRQQAQWIEKERQANIKKKKALSFCEKFKIFALFNLYWAASIILAFMPAIFLMFMYMLVFGLDDPQYNLISMAVGFSTFAWTSSLVYARNLLESSFTKPVKSFMVGFLFVCYSLSIMVFVLATLFSYSPVSFYNKYAAYVMLVTLDLEHGLFRYFLSIMVFGVVIIGWVVRIRGFFDYIKR